MNLKSNQNTDSIKTVSIEFLSVYPLIQSWRSTKNLVSSTLIFTFLVHLPISLIFAKKEFSQLGAKDVTIPSFGPKGEINWTLSAKEVTPLDGESTYIVKKPSLKMISKGNSISNATSDEGTFNLGNSTAHGQTLLEVSGDGFIAKGDSWVWKQQANEGTHQMELRSNTYVYFQSEIEPILPSKKEVAGKVETKMVKVANTTAMAQVIELITRDKGGYLFVLDGNVSIKGDSLEIFCSRMDVVVENDSNQSEMSFGRITEVNATGNVRMNQLGRVCRADVLILDTIEGKGLLLGNAKVEDVEWGAVSGEKVELDKNGGRARVIGTDKNKPRLELPNFGKINLPGFRNSQKKTLNP